MLVQRHPNLGPSSSAEQSLAGTRGGIQQRSGTDHTSHKFVQAHLDAEPAESPEPGHSRIGSLYEHLLSDLYEQVAGGCAVGFQLVEDRLEESAVGPGGAPSR